MEKILGRVPREEDAAPPCFQGALRSGDTGTSKLPGRLRHAIAAYFGSGAFGWLACVGVESVLALALPGPGLVAHIGCAGEALGATHGEPFGLLDTGQGEVHGFLVCWVG